MRLQQGFNLIEIAVTMAITSVGLLGLSSLQLQAMKATMDSGNRSQAIWVVNEIMNRMRANEAWIDSYNTDGFLECDDARFANIKMCSAYNDGAAKQAADNSCTGQEAANFDLFDALCGVEVRQNGVTYKVNSASFISSPKISIADAGDLDKTIAIRWNAQTSGFGDGGERKYTLDNTVAVQEAEYRIERFRP